MNKSKYFDMAGDIAASKLMPRPEVQVTISMQRGGGLGSLNEKPISSAYGRPIPRFIYREDGGPVIKRFGGGYSDVYAGVEGGVSDIGGEYAGVEGGVSDIGGEYAGVAGDPYTYDSPTFIDTTRGPTTTSVLQDDPKATPPTTPIQLDIGTGKTGLTKKGVVDDILDIPGVSKAARYFGLIPTVPRTGLLPPSQIEKQRISNQLQDVPFFTSNIPSFGLLPPSQRRTTPVSSGGRGTDPRDTGDWFEDDETDDKPITSPAQAFMDDLLKVGGQRYGMKEGYKNSERLLNDSLRTGSVHSVLDAAEKGKWGKAAKDLIVPPELSDIRDREIRLMGDRPSYKYKHGGGLSNLKKSIKINGQPHSLAWINPDEASALKAMGGSGKKVKGIPAYYFGWAGDEGGDADWGIGEVADTGGSDIGGEGQYAEATGGSDIGGEYVAGDLYTYDSPTFRTTGDSDTTTSRTVGDDYGAFGETQKDWEDYDFPDEAWLDEKSDMKSGFLGLFGDYMTNREALEGAHKVGYDNWRATAGQYSRDPGKDYDAWFNAQDKGALLAGYAVGDPYGSAMSFAFNNMSSNIQDKMKKYQDEIESISGEKATRKDLQNAARDAGVEDFSAYDGIDYPIWAPGGVLAAGMSLASTTVIGVGTVNGIRVHVHENGSISAISPEDSPGFVSGEDTGNEPQGRRRPRPVREVASVSETVEEDVAPAKGTMKELLSRRGTAATRAEGLASLKEGVLAQAYPGRDFNIG